MKKLLIVFVLISISLFAQSKENNFAGKFLLTGEGGVTTALTDMDYKLSFPTLRGSMEFLFPFESDHTLGLRAMFGYNKLEGKKGNLSFRNFLYDLKFGLTYGYNIDGVLPYVSGGINYPLKYSQKISDEQKKKVSAYGEAGLKILLADFVSLNLSGTLNFLSQDYLDLLPPSNKNDAYLTGQLGISFLIGYVAKDSDQDGVKDKEDMCPNTPLGVQVDASGCPLDADRDGVPDYLDKCPNTPSGVTVDKNGCPVDSDKDGVADYLDKCPNTPSGVAVDANGCPLDADKDGVPDYLDKCPNTPAGANVDANGCPVDSDKDGVADYLDKCPNTPAGTKVDAAGCPIVVKVEEKKEITLEGMTTFKTGKSELTPAAKLELDKVAEFIKERPTSKWVIEGHTDNVGSAKSNKKLSENRAISVMKYLISKGVNKNQLSSIGYGSEMPVASNDTEEGRQKNRRVVIKRIDK